jgi:hypothetical protein
MFRLIAIVATLSLGSLLLGWSLSAERMSARIGGGSGGAEAVPESKAGARPDSIEEDEDAAEEDYASEETDPDNSEEAAEETEDDRAEASEDSDHEAADEGGLTMIRSN